MFELPVDGGRAGSKWVLTAADSNYMLGQFDGERFTPDEPRTKLPGDRGGVLYAAQTFSGTPDGRRIQIGWGRIDTPGMPFNEMMGFPCELTLRATPDGVRMCSWPVVEIERLYSGAWGVRRAEVTPERSIRSDLRGELLDVAAEFESVPGINVELRVRGMSVRVGAGTLSCAGREAPLAPENGLISLRVLADRTSIEVFGNHGEVAMLMAGRFEGEEVELKSTGGLVRVDAFAVRALKSAWPADPGMPR
jgi:sucrose-6-phosphate hydrolase SacC (GH32 family)